MRTMLSDDDGTDWSIEIFDDPVGVSGPTKRVKQTSPTSSDSHSASGTKDVHPFFSRDFATKVTVSGNHPSAPATRPRTQDQMPGGRPTLAPVFTVAGQHAGQPSLVAKTTKQEGRIRPHPSLAYEFREKSLSYSGGQPFEQAQRQIQRPPRQPLPLTNTASSSSSTQISSGSKAGDGESSLPVYSFLEYKDAPAVVYTKSESEANRLVQGLKGPLGFDLEWRVIFRPGAPERRAALVQLCDYDTILLIQVSSMKTFPRNVLDIIESANIAKMGANILNDGEKLYRDFGIRAKGLVELGALATKADVKFNSVYNREIVSLAKMVAMYLGRTLLKGSVRTSNWEAHLSAQMVDYAANDCHCALMVYDRLKGIASEAGSTLDALTCARQVDPRSLKFKRSSSQTSSAQSLYRFTKPGVPDYCIPEPPRPQQLRAYKLWHVDNTPLDQMCMILRLGDRVEPLKKSTVISYVVGALQADPRLPFDMEQLKALVRMEAGSWQRHRGWISSHE